MKKIHILIPSLIATATMPLISLAGCGCHSKPDQPEFVDEIEWDFGKNGFYVPTEVKTDVQPQKQDEAITAYLTDVKNNKKALLDDILNTENIEFFTLKYIYSAEIQSYISKYKVLDINSENNLVSLQINRTLSYTVAGDVVQLKTDLTLTNIKYVSIYTMTHSEKQATNCWSFGPDYIGYLTPESFIQYMSSLDDDWTIIGTIEFPVSNLKIEYNWTQDNISETDISKEELQYLNQVYYGVDQSNYYSRCLIKGDKQFEWKNNQYQLTIDNDESKQYFDCDFSEEEFRSSNYFIHVTDKDGNSIKNQQINCMLDGKYYSLFTNDQGIAQGLPTIEKWSYLVIRIVGWPYGKDELTISLMGEN